MGMYRKFKMYKQALQLLLIVNVFVASWGLIAWIRYLESHDSSVLELAFAGTLTFMVGIAFPAWLWTFATRAIDRMRQQAEDRMLNLIRLGLEQLPEFSKERAENPLFWAQLALSLGEVFTKDLDHPAVVFFQEISPLIRREISQKLAKS